MEVPNGEVVNDAAIDASVSASDTNNAQTESGNVWEQILNQTEPNSTTAQKDAEELDELLDDTPDDEIPDEATEGDKPDEPVEKKSRSANFKQLQADKVALETQLAERDTEVQNAKKQLSTLDEALENYGGVEQVGTLIENQNKFIDPARYKEAVDYIQTLPQAPAVYAEILNRSFNIGDIELDEAASSRANINRIEVVNGALKKDFGLTADLSPEEMTAAFEWLAVRANKDKTELLTDIQDELELLAPDETDQRDKETQKRINDLEKKLEEQKNAAEKGETKQEEPLDAVKITTILNDYEADVMAKVSEEVLKDYGTTFDKLSPIKANAIKALVRQELGSGQVFIQLADYLITDKDHANGKYLATQYRNAVKTLIRSAAVEFLGKPSAATPPAKTPPSTGITGQGKTSIQPQPKANQKTNTWGEILNRN